MSDRKIFPEVPEDLATLSQDDAQTHLDTINALLLKVKARDEETLGDLTIPEAYEQVKAVMDVREGLAGRIAELVAAETSFDDEMEKVTEGITAPEVKAEADEPAPEGEDDGTEVPEPEAEITAEAEVPAEEVVAEPVLASATGVRAARPRPPAPAVQPEPPAETDDRAPLVASVGTKSVKQGQYLDANTLVAAMTEAYNMPSNGGREKRYVAQVDYSHLYPEDRRLMDPNLATNSNAVQEIIERAIQPQVLRASGGLCAPVTPYYNLMTIATAARPVRDSLPSFNAIRGGLQFGRPLNFPDVAGGVGVKTEAEDAAGGTFAVKDCVFVECPDFETVNLQMIWRCLQFGNLNSRAFPEMVNQAIELAIAYHARVADSALLDYIGDNSTHTTQAVQYGATSTLIDSILYAVAGMRSRNRMSIDARFRVLLPAWARELLSTDVVNSQFMRFDIKPNDVDALLRTYGVEPTWYLDTETGEGQIFGTQSAGVLLDFPNHLFAYIFPEGSFLFLDGGVLDLGVVRDSTLNSTNDFESWAESFEAAAFIGVESLRIDATICPNGAVANPATAFTCS